MKPAMNRMGKNGFAVVAAIFLLIVLSALGAFVVSISTTQHAQNALDIQGARAYQAARAGIEWGVWQVMNPENTNTSLAPFTTQYECGGGSGTSHTLAALGGTLAGFTVTVGCTFVDHPDAGITRRVYTLTSTAFWGAAPAAPASPDFVEREVVATVSTCRQLTGAPC